MVNNKRIIEILQCAGTWIRYVSQVDMRRYPDYIGINLQTTVSQLQTIDFIVGQIGAPDDEQLTDTGKILYYAIDNT